MFVRLPFRWGYLSLGRDMARNLDVAFEFGFGVRPNAGPHERNCRITGHVSWNWMPDRIYRIENDPSAAWTGREVVFAGFGQWRRSVGLTRIRAARKKT